MDHLPRRALAPALTWAATLALLLVAALTPGHLGDPAAPYRLVAYPLLGLLAPALWWLSHRSRPADPPYGGFLLVLLPFAIDTVSNVLDLYARISWWDDVLHFTNWLLLCGGLGLTVLRSVRPRWALALCVAGLGALLAIVWELGELAFFYADDVDRARLYTDTLGDQTLGTSGALVAGLLLAWGRRA